MMVALVDSYGLLGGSWEWLFPERRLDFLDLGPGTENKMGALLAQGVVLAWFFGLLWPRRGFWISLPLSCVAAFFLLQTQYGHTLREWLPGLGAVEVWQSAMVTDRDKPLRALAFSGREAWAGPEPLPVADRIVLFNPDAGDADKWVRRLEGQRVKLIIGGLGDWRRRGAWEAALEWHSNWEVIYLPGVADYIPNWPQWLVEGAEEGVVLERREAKR